MLPLHSSSPAYPFGGFVFNINAWLPPHRDGGDWLLCGVMPFGDFTDGSLVLYEARLVIHAEPGDWVLFPSKGITHFNTHYTGKRGSLVVHTHQSAKRWVKDLNGWPHIQREVDPSKN